MELIDPEDNKTIWLINKLTHKATVLHNQYHFDAKVFLEQSYGIYILDEMMVRNNLREAYINQYDSYLLKLCYLP